VSLIPLVARGLTKVKMLMRVRSKAMEELIKELYDEWEVDSHLTEPEYIKFVKDSYSVLVENAKLGKIIFYGELPVFDELKKRFSDAASKLIGFIIGATAGLMIYITVDEIIPNSCAGTDHRTIFYLLSGIIFVILLGLI